MSVWPKLDEIEDKYVTEAYEYIVQLLRERHPELDIDRGVLFRLVCGLHAILHGATRQMLDKHDLPKPNLSVPFETSNWLEACIMSDCPLVQAVSIICAGDREMQRDKINGFSLGGCVDVYLRTKELSQLEQAVNDVRVLVEKIKPLGYSVRVLPAFVCKLAVKLDLDGGLSDKRRVATVIADFVNSRNFDSKLYASSIAGLLRAHMPDGVEVRSVMLSAKAEFAANTYSAQSNEMIAVPTDFLQQISKRTVAIYLSPEDVSVIEG